MTEKKTLSAAQLEQFCRGLALLLHAGIRVLQYLFAVICDIICRRAYSSCGHEKD